MPGEGIEEWKCLAELIDTAFDDFNFRLWSISRRPSRRGRLDLLRASIEVNQAPELHAGPTTGFPARACGPRRRVPWRPAVSCGLALASPGRHACRPGGGLGPRPATVAGLGRRASRAGPGDGR